MKFKSYVIFFLLFCLLPDVYILSAVMRASPLGWKLMLCLPTLAAIVCLPLIKAGIRYTDSLRVYSYLMFIFGLPKAVMMLFSLILRYLVRMENSPADLASAVVGAGVSVFFIVMIFFVSRHLKVRETELSFRDLPQSFDSLRVCHISDFHLGSFGRKAVYIKRIMDTVAACKPDIILFTGDLVNFDTAEAYPYREELSRLEAPLGVIACRGNHDYLLHGNQDEGQRLEDTARLLSFERELGWKVLLNESVMVRRGDGEIAIAGVENTSANPYFPSQGGDLGGALSDIPEGTFTILLSHDPSHWRFEVIPNGSVALTLSGHTHGLKFKLAGMHLSSWRLRESGGIYREGEKVLHVSRGLGSAFAFRLGGFPYIDILTLKRI